ncbi:MAG: cation:proton antiporter family protein [Gammaproteobacteria bacterium]|nr:cation:proton antiporter family protein [Gammaproteobacteria bacterium]
MLIAVPLATIAIILGGMLVPDLALPGVTAAATLAFALAFSSTVFAVKMFEDRGETTSFHANIAIGVLVIQDIIAVIYLVAVTGSVPTLWAIALLALPLARPALIRVMQWAGHGELLTLLGITIALGGAELFEAANVKGGLGALLFGIIMGNSPKSTELYNSLISFKDLFLIGFFIQIGFYGLPSPQMWLVAGTLSLLIFLRPLIYYFLFVAFKLRARTALLSSLALFNYSEFGLIVSAAAVSEGILPTEWVTTLALAVTISFFIATPFNAAAHNIYNRLGGWLHRFERDERLPQEQPADLGDAEIVVLGMGRIGKGAYHYLEKVYPNRIVSVDENYDKVIQHRDAGINCVHGDANDHDFWHHGDLQSRQLILVSLTNHSENMMVIRLAREMGFENNLAVVSRYPDEERELNAMGCITFNLYGEAGHGFAEHVMDEIGSARASPS